MAHPQDSSEFSFDLYPGLDAELEAAYARNLGQNDPSADVAHSGLAAVVSSNLQQSQPNHLPAMAEKVHEWAGPQLKEGLSTWHNYNDLLSHWTPPNPEHLAARNPNFATTMARLYEAHQGLLMSSETNPEGMNIGETMHLVLVPWGEFKAHLPNLQEFVNELRAKQGLATNTQDYLNDHILNAVQQNTPFYRDPDTNRTGLLTATEYLDRKISQDGDWGIMLVQDSKEAGIDRLKGQSPNELTRDGQIHLVNSGSFIDNMGIFEWLSLTLQKDPRELSPSDYSWMLANRIDVDGVPCVPRGDFRGGQVRSRLGGAGNDDSALRPRLAVM
jgi:hypothetical protein